MNRFVIFVFLSLASFAWADFMKMIEDPEMSKECMDQSKLDPAVFKEAKEDPTKLETKEFKCFVDCIGKKMGAFTDDGEPVMDKMTEKVADYGLDEEKVKEEAEKCAEETKDVDGECEKIPSFTFCLMKAFKPE